MKLFLFSILSLIISTLIPLSDVQVVADKQIFIDVCESGYDNYLILHTEETSNYYMQIIGGDIDNVISYSIIFISSNPHEYQIAFKKENNKNYLFPAEDNRGGAMVYQLQIENSLIIEIQKEGITTYSYQLYKDSYDQQLKSNNPLLGKGEGLPVSELSKGRIINLVYLLSIIFSGIIIISIIIILVLFYTKKGLFNEDKMNNEFKNEHQFREDIRSYVTKEQEIYEVSAEEVEIDNAQKNVYQKIKDYDLDDTRDISQILRDKGFRTEYKSLTTDEKNEVMLELMKMKNFKEITEEEYREEIIKLWM